MSEMKRCQQCGLLKDVENYRPYTYTKQKGTQGRYRICRQCEAINSRYKRAVEMCREEVVYLANGTCLNPDVAAAKETVKKIEQLYKQLAARGLRVPGTRAPIVDQATQAIDMLLDFYSDDTPPKPTVEYSKESVPGDLAHWLNSSQEDWLENDLSPEYLQETVYESLKAKYRPQIGIDKERLLPIYDDTYKAVLNDILKRFDEFEEYVTNQEPE